MPLRGIPSVCEKLKTSPALLDNVTYFKLQHASGDVWRRVKKNITIPCDDGKRVKIQITEPSKLLPLFMSEKDSFGDLYFRAMEMNPPSRDWPWRLAVAFDEF